MVPTKSWRCDACGELVEKAEDGWVEWFTYRGADADPRAGGLRLVHHRRNCQYDQRMVRERHDAGVADSGLSDFLGHDGLMLLLSMIAEGELPTADVVEMIQRLHIPGYESARAHLRRAVAEGVIEPNMPRGFFWQREIETVIRWAKENPPES